MFKSIKTVWIALVIFMTLTGCAWFDESEHEKIVGEYEVGWNDMVRNRSISKPTGSCSGCYVGLVSGYVYAVGHNDSFIIAKRHPSTDTVITYYYVIDIKKNEMNGNDKGIYEFMDKKDFDSLRNRLNISNIPFDMNYPVNP